MSKDNERQSKTITDPPNERDTLAYNYATGSKASFADTFEEHAFKAGYNARDSEVSRLEARVTELDRDNASLRIHLEINGDAIKKLNALLAQAAAELNNLSNEAEGFLSMASVADHGVTNIRCLEMRIQQARITLNASGFGKGEQS